MKINFKTQIKLMEECGSHNTHLNIQHCLSLAIWAGDPDTCFKTFSTPLCQEAAIAQHIIGWQNLLKGKVSSNWRDLQEWHLHNIGALQVAAQWAVGLVTRLLEFTHSQ
jgi:hypothetical protein